MSADRVREIQKISQEPVSLETPFGEEEDSQLGDFIEDAQAVVPADAASFSMLQEQLTQVLDGLASLETPFGEEEDSQLGDFIEDAQAVVPADAASFSMLQEQLTQVLDGLAERERQVIELRFGHEDGHPRTLEEVGREFGVTRERIRQIESKTLAKLRHPSRSSKLKDYLAGRVGARVCERSGSASVSLYSEPFWPPACVGGHFLWLVGTCGLLGRAAPRAVRPVGTCGQARKR